MLIDQMCKTNKTFAAKLDANILKLRNEDEERIKNDSMHEKLSTTDLF